jgi:glycosyltransferase involved in cell wall biosynthesis
VARTFVSICLPAFNGADWIGEAIDSALAQTHEALELVVVDNHSTDGTPDVVAAYDDERIRLIVNDATFGAPENHNLAVRAARGALVKFLHHDDRLAPTCLERMVPVFEESSRVGLVFSRREVVVDPADAKAVAWRERFATLHHPLGPLDRVNSGPALLARYLPGLGGPQLPNWLAEPSSVMVRASALDRVGLFTTRMRQSWDVELWLRIMASSDVGFVDEPLALYRYHASSLTRANASEQRDWLDLAWLYEGLLAIDELGEARALVRRDRRRETARLVRRSAARLARRRGLEGLGGYAAYRVRRAFGRAPALHG